MHYTIITFPEFILYAIYMQLVNTCQPPYFLIGAKINSQKWMTVKHTPTIAVAMNCQFSQVAYFFGCG